MNFFKRLKYEVFDQGYGLLTICNVLTYYMNKYFSKKVRVHNDSLRNHYKDYFGKDYSPVPAAFHNHSIHSLDGALRVKDLVDYYGRSGYKVVEISDHNVIMSDEEYEYCSRHAMKKYGMLLVPSVERAFFHQQEGVKDRRALSVLLEARTLFDPEKTSMDEIRLLNPCNNGGGPLPSKKELLEKTIPEYCRKVVSMGGLVVFTHPSSFSSLARNGLTSLLKMYDYEYPSIDAKECYDESNDKHHLVLRTGATMKEIKSIIEELDEEYKSSVMVEDINPIVHWINMDDSYDSVIHCRKNGGLYPYIRVGEKGLSDLFNVLRSLSTGWDNMSFNDFKKGVVRHEGINDYFLYLDHYDAWVRDELVPLLKEKIPSIEVSIGSENLSIHGVSGIDFHGRGSRNCCGDMIYLGKGDDYKISSLFKALKNKKSFPYSRRLGSSFLNKFLVYTSSTKSIYLKRLVQVVFNNGKYYRFNKLKKNIRESLSEEYGYEDKLGRLEAAHSFALSISKSRKYKRFVKKSFKKDKKRIMKSGPIVPFYELYNAVISEQTRESF